MIVRKFFKSLGHTPDYVIIGLVCFLVLSGFLFLTSASSDIAKIKLNDSYFYLKSQLIKGFLPGLFGFAVGYFVYYRRWKKVSAILILLNIILLILVFTPLGYAAKGSNRWIHLGSFSFQPSEFLKFTFILYLASLFSSTSVKRLKGEWKSYWLFLGVSLVIALLIIIQPATTMAVIVIGAGAVMYFFSGASAKQVLITAAVGFSFIALLAVITPYRFHRVAPYWNAIVQHVSPSLMTTSDTGDTFHLDQSLIAIGNGKIGGVGFGKSTSKYSVLPEPMGDSIFSVIAEEFGFVGSCVIIGAFILLFWRITHLVNRSHDDFAKLILLGFSSVIAIQTIIHIAANTGMLPFTGVPLPFISYGGTSLAVSLTMLGVVANISRHTNHS